MIIEELVSTDTIIPLPSSLPTVHSPYVHFSKFIVQYSHVQFIISLFCATALIVPSYRFFKQGVLHIPFAGHDSCLPLRCGQIYILQDCSQLL